MSTVIHYTIPLAPVSKKNSSQILTNRATGRPFVMPSKAYKAYEEKAGWFLKPLPRAPISCPVEVKCIFYMPTRRRVDRPNLESAIHDILVKYKVLADDNRDVIASGDGTRVYYDKENPRTEIYISRLPESEEYTVWADEMKKKGK